ncbi:MAG: transferase [Gemmatimonadaceae bacterium]|nr:transferase [Gemmatimonadaceae bacterium]
MSHPIGARRRLIIIGAGGLGRETLWTAEEIPADQRDWEIAGFLDDDVDGARDALARCGVDLPVIGGIIDHSPHGDEVFVPAIPSPRARLGRCNALRSRGASFVNLRHPTSLVHRSATLGEGVVLRQYTGVGPNAVLGDFVFIDLLGGPAHDVVVGDGCHVGAHSDIMGGAVLGRGVTLGAHAAVLPGARVGDFATVGAGSVVIRRVAPGATVFGVPAQRLMFVPPVQPDDSDGAAQAARHGATSGGR